MRLFSGPFYCTFHVLEGLISAGMLMLPCAEGVCPCQAGCLALAQHLLGTGKASCPLVQSVYRLWLDPGSAHSRECQPSSPSRHCSTSSASWALSHSGGAARLRRNMCFSLPWLGVIFLAPGRSCALV